MTELTEVDTANCPHCRSEVSGDELNAMLTAEAEEAVLVCPECDTILGGAMGDGMFSMVVSTLLAENVRSVPEVNDAMKEALSANGPGDVDEEAIDLLDDRMGN